MPVQELSQKWNTICGSVHKQAISLERNLSFSPSSSPSSSSTSFFSYDQHHNGGLWDCTWQVFEANKHSCREPKQAISPVTTSTPNSASSSDLMEMEYIPRFKEFNSENLNLLCNALEQKVPWQKDVVPEIAGTILQCRSGMLKRKGKVRNIVDEVKEETWLFFQGLDVQGKEKIARELAKIVFGSHSNFITVALSSFSSARADSTEDYSRSSKRLRDEQSCSYIGRLAQEISSNPHRVFLVEDVEQADFRSQMGIKRAIERGKINSASSGEEVSLSDAIIILSCERFSSRSRACSPPVRQKLDGLEQEEEEKGSAGNNIEIIRRSPYVSLDLNICMNEEERVEDESMDDVGMFENVDGRIVFKMHGMEVMM